MGLFQKKPSKAEEDELFTVETIASLERGEYMSFKAIMRVKSLSEEQQARVQSALDNAVDAQGPSEESL